MKIFNMAILVLLLLTSACATNAVYYTSSAGNNSATGSLDQTIGEVPESSESIETYTPIPYKKSTPPSNWHISFPVTIGYGKNWIEGEKTEELRSIFGYSLSGGVSLKYDDIPLIFEPGVKYITRGYEGSEFTQKLNCIDLHFKGKFELKIGNKTYQPYIGLALPMIQNAEMKWDNAEGVVQSNDFTAGADYINDKDGIVFNTDLFSPLNYGEASPHLLFGTDILIGKSFILGVEVDYGSIRKKEDLVYESEEEWVWNDSIGWEIHNHWKLLSYQTRKYTSYSVLLNLGYRFDL